MKIRIWTIAISLLMALLISPPAMASGEAMAPPAPAASPAASPHKHVAVKKNATRKSRQYSPATLSAFAPYVETANSPAAADATTLVNQQRSADLRGPRAAATGKLPMIAVEPARAARLVDDDDAHHDAFEQAANSLQTSPIGEGVDADSLGSDAVSVIDRISDKPKAKAIATGPLRVRVNDRALRASVQIPISTR